MPPVRSRAGTINSEFTMMCKLRREGHRPNRGLIVRGKCLRDSDSLRSIHVRSSKSSSALFCIIVDFCGMSVRWHCIDTQCTRIFFGLF